MTLLVTGAGGQLGRRVVELLIDSHAGRLVAVTRRPERLAPLVERGLEVRRADFDDVAGLAQALRGADRMLLVSTDAVDVAGRRRAQHLAAVRAAARAGVSHVVYTSISHPAPESPAVASADHLATERALSASGMSWTVLRNNLYTDLLVPMLFRAAAGGRLLAAARGGAAFVTRDNCALAAAVALVSGDTTSRALEITGPAVIDHAQLAVLASELTGRPVSHVEVAPAELRASLVSGGMPERTADIVVSSQAGMSLGRFSPPSSDFRVLTGLAPTSVPEFLLARREMLVPELVMKAV